jgi:hypothetical protein
MPNQHTRRTPKRPKSNATARIDRLRSEVESLSSRLDEMHEIIARKNTVIRLMALGDCSSSEFGLSDR